MERSGEFLVGGYPVMGNAGKLPGFEHDGTVLPDSLHQGIG
jgi:hypothetical protein